MIYRTGRNEAGIPILYENGTPLGCILQFSSEGVGIYVIISAPGESNHMRGVILTDDNCDQTDTRIFLAALISRPGQR